MKIVKIASLVWLLFVIVLLFPLNPYLSAILAIISIGTAFLIRRK